MVGPPELALPPPLSRPIMAVAVVSERVRVGVANGGSAGAPPRSPPRSLPHRHRRCRRTTGLLPVQTLPPAPPPPRRDKHHPLHVWRLPTPWQRRAASGTHAGGPPRQGRVSAEAGERRAWWGTCWAAVASTEVGGGAGAPCATSSRREPLARRGRRPRTHAAPGRVQSDQEREPPRRPHAAAAAAAWPAAATPHGRRHRAQR